MGYLVLYLFEIGYIFQHLATVCQIYKMIKKNNSELVSLETNILFLIGALSRIGWMYDSGLRKLPLAYIEVVLAISSLSFVIYLYHKNKVKTLYSNEVQLPVYLKLYVLIPIVVVLAFFFNPGNRYFTSQFFVSLGIFAEAIGLLPQFYMIKKSKDTGDLSELYIVFLGIARFIRLIFWIKMYWEGKQFLELLITDFIHLAILSGFIYNAIVNWSGRGLPTFNEVSRSNKKMF